MKTIFKLTILTFFIASCTNYQSEKYIKEESQAISDLIEEMVDAKDLLRNNDYGKEKPKLIILEDLQNELFSCNYNHISKEDKKSLKPLITKKINSRKLNINQIQNINLLTVKLVSITEFENNEIIKKVMNNELFGFLSMSRVIFSSNFKTGYILYDVYCGVGCTWYNLMEIKKVNGKWIKKRIITGGIA